jgi:hypothetical protein
VPDLWRAYERPTVSIIAALTAGRRCSRDLEGVGLPSRARDPSALYGQFSMLHVIIRDLEVRTYDDPQIGGSTCNA